eukprot:CAMPEP_0117432538 /NCGR_PEP_ID=MMETSP0758-20121206/12002_1 /TAXON_ID=63605 /ORGANISM="Percolomonas cosmopolitus, Strain AE-1 (ATCC 50343)" /LENGTH=652 /DNA_ID=CAMNT_0005222507 /DNA_START=2099 /DNA_END=4054 /DNA_ORIENTATION=-
MDEIHLLGSERGAILEVIVSRMRYIAWSTGQHIRLLGLSTTIANSHDMAEWLGINGPGVFNFKPSVRPVSLDIYINGFSEKFYCPRMELMNKPTYNAIMEHSPNKPVLVFVSSRRQTRLTANGLISLCAIGENPTQFVKMSDYDLGVITQKIKDPHLRHVVQYGVGIHHAGLIHADKKIVEELFLTNKIQVLVCTSTLAWGVNFPAHLVVVKGTKFFDPKLHQYVDYPLVDVLQMMGRAGRPQFDNEGKAVIFCKDDRKDFYSKFLYESFPVESHLLPVLHDHINAEIVSGTISTFQEAVDYLTWTFMFRRLVRNPSYYGVEDGSFEGLTSYLSKLVEKIIKDLEKQKACIIDNSQATVTIRSSPLGNIASYYYMSYKSIHHFAEAIEGDKEIDLEYLLQLVCESEEFSELPVRHSEDELNEKLLENLPFKSFTWDFESPHLKAFVLLQIHFNRDPFPIADYVTDLKSVLDQSIRIIQAYIDVATVHGNLNLTLLLCNLLQMIVNCRWYHENPLRILEPYMTKKHQKKFKLPHLVHDRHIHTTLVNNNVPYSKIDRIINRLHKLPQICLNDLKCTKVGSDAKVEFSVHRISNPPKSAYTPNYPKPLEEGYWAIVGEYDNDGNPLKLCALKRIRLGSRRNAFSSLSMKNPQNN